MFEKTLKTYTRFLFINLFFWFTSNSKRLCSSEIVWSTLLSKHISTVSSKIADICLLVWLALYIPILLSDDGVSMFKFH